MEIRTNVWVIRVGISTFESGINSSEIWAKYVNRILALDLAYK